MPEEEIEALRQGARALRRWASKESSNNQQAFAAQLREQAAILDQMADSVGKDSD